jgi:hypothetical protein
MGEHIATHVTPRLVVQRQSYSVDPWTIVDSVTGEELCFRRLFDHPQLGAMPLSTRGFPTKQAAIDALGEIAWRAWDAHRAQVGGAGRHGNAPQVEDAHVEALYDALVTFETEHEHQRGQRGLASMAWQGRPNRDEIREGLAKVFAMLAALPVGDTHAG